MKKRRFLQNKLWRDALVDRLTKEGSVIHWKRLDDENYDKQLRRKLIEEANEVNVAFSKEELIEELADILEVYECLCNANGISADEVVAAKQAKQAKRGGFHGRKYVTFVEHFEDSFETEYCLKQPEKYPEIL